MSIFDRSRNKTDFSHLTALFSTLVSFSGTAFSQNALMGSIDGDKAKTTSPARYFKCWAASKTSDNKWLSNSNQVISDQGGAFFVGDKGQYRVTLSQVVYGNDKQVPVLKLGIHQGHETKTISYSWVEPEGARIGINLGPVQAGCALLTESELMAQVQEVKSHLLGLMDSSVQSIENSNYFDVSIQHCEIKLTDPQNLDQNTEKGSEFLLILQSISTSDAPYRVRIAKLSPSLNQGGVASTNFLVRENLNLTKMCDLPKSERVLNSQDLVLNKCTTYMRKSGDKYSGGTLPEGCPSSLRGATRVSNEVTLSPRTMNSWDRGWKADGSQAWGAVQGPYRFRKVTNQDPLLSQLAGFMSGHLDNSEQVAANPNEYTPVSYQICQIDSSPSLRSSVRLLFAKQSISTPEGQRERNRVYRLQRNAAGQFEITTNKFDESKISADTCDKTQFERMRTDLSSVAWDKSCPVLFSYDVKSKSYIGATPAEGCASTYRGSVKFQSDETISNGLIAPWERWFDAAGNLVAGSQQGAYVYKRLKN
jgi:hypothetical protein